MYVFEAWWGFSVKYFMPWSIMSLLMLSLNADLTLDKNGNGYGGYHIFWQVMGFMFPIIGLICFIVPLFLCTTQEPFSKDVDNDFGDMGFTSKPKREAEMVAIQ